MRHFADAKKPIAAVCHAAQVLAAAGVLEGKSCSAYPAVGPDVNRAGGKYVEVPVDAAHVDGNPVAETIGLRGGNLRGRERFSRRFIIIAA